MESSANKFPSEQREQTLSLWRIRIAERIQIAKDNQVHLVACGSKRK